MNTKLFLLPSLCLGGAALLLAPARPSQAFTTIGGSLGESQRDVRVFDNFLDATADDNAAAASQFPGWTGLELAVWKAITEWGSQLHGDGSGDINGNTLGSGGANFDSFWAGNAVGAGNNNNNIVSSQATCGGGGTLAFTETPISDGWRIKFCDEWTWDDGPGTVGNRFDIQSVMCHEYGHALGLGHSSGGATMAPAVGAGSTTIRSIATDDINGVQSIYGVKAGTKPTIVATVCSGGSITIYGSQYTATGNEVWFAPSAVTATSVDPIVRVLNVTSSLGGTKIVITIPAGASPGDVMINKTGSGGATLSNAFPTDLVGTFGTPPLPHPDITNVTPSSIAALIPGTAQTITISGTDLNNTSSVTIDTEAIPAERWTIVNPTTITLDMPQVLSLGAHDLGVSDGSTLDEFPVTVAACTTPTLEWGSGDPANVIVRGNGLDLIIAGPVGELENIAVSTTGSPTLGDLTANFALGHHGPSLARPGAYRIPGEGWFTVHIDNLPDPNVVGANWFAKAFAMVSPPPFVGGNDQSITLVP